MELFQNLKEYTRVLLGRNLRRIFNPCEYFIAPVFLLGLFAFSELFLAANASPVLVDCPFGKIQGSRKTDQESGVSFVEFRGIPYAKPPLGELRFAKPQPHPVLTEVFNASKEDRIVCPHPHMFELGETSFTEDCLVLNIQAKDAPFDPSDQASLKKVLVFMHGGGFIIGTSYLYRAHSFVNNQDVIVVSLNYRLGVLGFLSTENEASVGNYGLWDQLLALRWVKDNIRAFGGNPKDVTVAGQSAGSTSAGLLSISPYAKGLFTKAYLQSGSPTSVFARYISPVTEAMQVAKQAGCLDSDKVSSLTEDESRAMIQCLRKVPLESITAFNMYTPSKPVFVPRVDGDFLPGRPEDLLEDDSYLDSVGFFERAYLIGVTNLESPVFANFLQNTKNVLPFIYRQFSDEEREQVWQGIRQNADQISLEARLGKKWSHANASTSQAVEEFYSVRLAEKDQVTAEIMTDLGFLVPALDLARAASRNPSCNAFLLYFNHFSKVMTGKHRGTPHGLDLAYWFDIKVSELETVLSVGMSGELPEKEQKLKKTFSSLVGDFVKHGNPGVSLGDALPCGWPRFNVSNAYYLNFNLRPRLDSFLEKDKYDFWMETVPGLMKQNHVHSEL